MRNFNDKYSIPEDLITLKYNTIVVSEENVETSRIPFDLLQVESWWIKQQKIELFDSQVDINNVLLVDIINHDTSVSGEYIFSIERFSLHGQLLSASQLMAITSLIWIVVIALLILQQREHLLEQATKDTLTKIANRRGLQEWISDAIAKSTGATYFSTIYIDLDDFKYINDTFGHAVGDLLLIRFSQKVSKMLELKFKLGTDGLLARLSGDEFLIVLKDEKHLESESIAKQILLLFKDAQTLEKAELRISMSMGIASQKQSSDNLKSLINKADNAMYLAKETGKNQYKIYNKNMNEGLFQNKALAKELSIAIEQNDFDLRYMPTFHVESKKVSSIEVLLRTTNPKLSTLSTREIIAIAEQYKLIKSLDTWMVKNAFEALNQHRDLVEKLGIRFSLNISSFDLKNDALVNLIAESMQTHKVPPDWLEIEVSEASLGSDQTQTISALNALRAMGVKLSLDNFGTGFTAFNELGKYPIQKIKIDRSFVAAINQGSDEKTVFINAVMAIAEAYKLEVTANGVETLDQFYYLKDLGCGYIQGRLFSEPLGINGLRKTLQHQCSDESIETS